ncbi:MAG: metallophosphoesterase [Magnetococcales bacterium]|nr:metallophosphoesterase [Magnetococcales bacterium]
MGSWFTVVLSDTDNDIKSIHYSLWMLGLVGKSGKWKKGLDNFRLVHTGDWLNKSHPKQEVITLFETMRDTLPESAKMVILNGNHELAILQKSDNGNTMGLSKAQLEFIRNQDIMYVHANNLFIHGYPTFELLRLLIQLQEESVDLNAFNDRFRKAYYEGKYALFREREGMAILGDIRQAQAYYRSKGSNGKSHGRVISQMLKKLGIDTVIHGHRPNMLVQQDFEFKLDVPGIRFINNDNKARLSKLGATLIKENDWVRFINPREMYWAGGEKSYRKSLRKLLGTRKKDLNPAVEQPPVSLEPPLESLQSDPPPDSLQTRYEP